MKHRAGRVSSLIIQFNINSKMIILMEKLMNQSVIFHLYILIINYIANYLVFLLTKIYMNIYLCIHSKILDISTKSEKSYEIKYGLIQNFVTEVLVAETMCPFLQIPIWALKYLFLLIQKSRINRWHSLIRVSETTNKQLLFKFHLWVYTIGYHYNFSKETKRFKSQTQKKFKHRLQTFFAI